jgi:hypothetical protein
MHSNKIFCISVQRTGTTSVGRFFYDFGFTWRGWPHSDKNQWAYRWSIGDLETIFRSQDFITGNAFEDSPWWYPDFYKILYHRFPQSKFILLHRDPDKWFASMLSHSSTRTLGNTKRHCKVYRREHDLKFFVENHPHIHVSETKSDNLLSMKGKDEHYKSLYIMHNSEVHDFFKLHSPESLFSCRLEDPEKWIKLGDFLGVDASNYHTHQNKSLK